MAEDWKRLGQLVSQRRGHLRLAQKDFAAAVGVSVKTINNLENDRSAGMRATTIAALEDALGWMPGSVQQVLDGRDPLVTGQAQPGDRGPTASTTDGGHVGPAAEDAEAYVADRGPGDRSPGITDDELLDEIRRVRAEVDERFDDLERRLRDRSVEGPS